MQTARKTSLKDRMNQRTRVILPQQIHLQAPENPIHSSALPPAAGRALRFLALAGLLLLTAAAQAQAVFSAPQNITTTATQTVTVTATAAGAVNKVAVLTNGAPGLDFIAGGGSSTCASAALTVGATCTQSVSFTPAFPGLRVGAVELLDGNKNVLGTAYLSGVGVGGLDVLTPGNETGIAGVYKVSGTAHNGGPADQSPLHQPASVALDGAGNIYIADSANNEVRMVCFSATSATIAGVTCPGARIIVGIAGTGEQGYTGDGQLASSNSVTFNSPSGVALDGAGNLYIADSGNNVIREVSAATGIIATIAGNGKSGYGGDGTKATSAGVEFDNPLGVTTDVYGNIYIADTTNQRIRVIDAATGIITTLAGNGLPSGAGDGKGTYSGDGGAANVAGLSLPYAVAFDLYGDMFIPDSGNNRIRVVKATNGVVTGTSPISTAAGTSTSSETCVNGPTATTPLNSPEGVAVDAAINIYISDTGDECVRKANVTTGQMEMLALTQVVYPGAITKAGVPNEEEVYSPVGITLDGLGNVYYADYYFMLISEIESNKAVLNYQITPIRQGDLSAPQTIEVENDGNASSSISALTPDKNAKVDAATTTCSPLPFTLTEDHDCNVGAIFAPSITIDPTTLPGTVIGNIDVANNTVNNLLDIVLIGDATPVNSTTISLTSSPNPSEFGQNVTVTATVTTGASATALTGTVTFQDTFNGVTNTLSTPIAVNGTGVATYFNSSFAVGVHNLTAVYNGDPNHLATVAGQQATATQTVFEDTKTLLTAAPQSPSALGASVTFTAAVSVTDGGAFPLDGSVTFSDSLAALPNNTVAIANGVATFTTAALVEGVNVITATYTPNTTTLIKGSIGTLSQDVVVSSTVTVTSAPNPSIYGNAVTFTVSVPSNGASAATGKVNIVIVPAGQTTPTYPITATLTGNPGTGTAAIATLPVGTYTATANYLGDTNFAASSGTLPTPQVVNQVATTTVLNANPNPGIAGKAVAITATVTPTTGTVTPTGTVTFTDTFNGATVTLGTGAVTVGTTGTATVNTSTLAPGTHSIVANYGGDANDAKSSATLSLTINQATTTTVVTPTPNPALVQQLVTFTATVTGTGALPTGTVNFLANGTIALGSGVLDATGKATATNATLPAGTYQITAVYVGDANDTGSTSPSVSLVVGTIPTTTGLTTASTTGANPQTILVSTVMDSGMSGPVPTGIVTFKNGTTIIGTATLNSDGVTTLTPDLAAGTYSIIAYYPGDALHGASQSTPVSISGAASSYTLVVTPATVSVATTQNANLTVTLTSISGFTDSIALGCAGLPAGVNCHFSTILVPLGANAVVTSTLTIDTNNPLGGGETAMNRQAGKTKTDLATLFLPFTLLLGWVLWRFRKRNSSVWSVVLILALSGAALLATGCAGFSQNSAKPGTYTIQVVGVGQNSDVEQYQNVTLTVTP